MKDLNEAIVLGREAFDLRPRGHPDRSGSLGNLAIHLSNRFTRSKQLQDKEELFGLYAQLVHVPQIVSSIDLSVARAWISVAEDFHHPTILLAYEISLWLLIRLHSPLDDAIGSSPAGKILTDEFTRLALLIRNAINSPGINQHERICHLNLEMQRVVTSVRKLPGLSRFLLPSLFPDLQRAASGGPVIIVNASGHSCDTLVVLLHRDPVHIPLQITQENVRDLSKELHSLTVRAMGDDVTRDLAFFLRKLWDQIVSPIVDFLQTTHPSRSRIWWCPTAEFSVLPLHAAGPYRKGQQNLPDLYTSSYTPTLTALIRARRCDPSNSTAAQKRCVAIG